MEYRISDKLACMKPSAIREIFKATADPSVIPFSAGNPAAETFPVSALAEISAEIFESAPTAALQYGQTEGYPPLREAVAKRMREKFGIGKSISRGDAFNDVTCIVSGGNQGLELAAKVMCNEGDVVLAEEPSFIGALNAFRSNGARVVGVKMEGDGVDLAALEAALKSESRAKLFYTIPTFHNPLGITEPWEKRVRVYELCRKYGVLILEDNPYGELRFAGEDVPTIKSIDDDGIVIYCSSFSKILSAGMRVGFVVAPEPVMQKMVVAKQVEDVQTNGFFQILCHKFMTERDIDGHIANVRAVYRRKCGIMLSSLEKYLPKTYSYTRPEGGLFVWVTLPEGVDVSAFVAACLARKLAVVPGDAFSASAGAHHNAIRISYSTATDEQIVEGCRILGEVASTF